VTALIKKEWKDYAVTETTSSNGSTTPKKTLIEYFMDEPLGMYKANLCRGAALYETGGLYFDADLGVCMNVFTGHGEVCTIDDPPSKPTSSSLFVLNPTTEFVTVKAPRHSDNHGGFF
jgi:hypothetical protein